MSGINRLEAALKGKLVVSCQPIAGGAMDDDETVARLACAALAGGAGGVRIEGVARVARVRAATTAPIIGIVKRDLADFPVRITPTVADVAALIAAGADIVAVDATARARPTSVASLYAEIRRGNALAMADCATLADADAAHTLGFELIGTTLAGYTGGTVPIEPDYALLASLTKKFPRIIAEGRFNQPQQVAEAMRLGAWAVTVGTAITRTEIVTSWFAQAVKRL